MKSVLTLILLESTLFPITFPCTNENGLVLVIIISVISYDVSLAITEVFSIFFSSGKNYLLNSKLFINVRKE